MPKKTKEQIYIVSGEEIKKYKAMMITAKSSTKAIEEYDEMWQNGDLIVEANEFEIEIAK
jgi:hypothetical protein